jgi:serine/threonine protein kinase/tetratricopeptide (TPR) repeat protein
MDENRRLLDLATSVSDSEEVDWEAAEQQTVDEQKEVIRALRVISGIFQAHRSWHDSLKPQEGAAVESNATPLDQWGHLEILEKVGEGSFGEVYRARDTRLDRVVALKLIYRQGAAPEMGTGLTVLHEARLLARVRHPNVAIVHGADEREGRIGFWMEFLQGRTLSELLQEQGPFGARETVLIGLDLCHALAAVHREGILHRDVKAQNVIRETGGRIVLTDFGIGRDLQTPAKNGLSGTPLYLAPEVLAGGDASVRSEIYSLGVLLYYVATGHFPVWGSSLEDLRQAHEQGQVRRLRDVRPDLPDPFIQVVERALEREPARRYESMGALEQALREVLVPDADEPARGAVLHRRLLSPWAIAAILALAVLVGVLALRPDRWKTQPGIPETVLVGAFENSSGVALFDETVRHLVGFALEQSSRLKVVPRERINEALSRMRQPAGTPLSPDTAREICLREGIGTFVTGKIEAAGPGYRVVVRATDGRSGELLFLQTALFPKEQDLIPAIGNIAEELRGALGEPHALVRQNRRPLDQVTTSSLEALQRFSQALDLHAQGHIEVAIESLEMAIDLDPEFAMAYSRLSTYQNGIGLLEESFASADQAYRLRSRVSERERYQIESTYHINRLQYDEAIRALQRAVLLDPADANSHRHIAMLHANLGNAEAGLGSARTACRLLPRNVIVRGVLVVLLAAANRPDEAIDEVRKARRSLGDDPYFYWGEGLALLGKGDSMAAKNAFHRLMKGDPTYESHGRLFLAQALIYEGRLREAAEELEAGLGLDLRMGFQRNAAIRTSLIAGVNSLLRDRPETLLHVSRLEDLKDVPIHLKHLRSGALLYCHSGEISKARALLARIEKIQDLYPSPLSSGSAAQIRGEIEQAAGRTAQARRSLEEARLHWADPPTLDSLARFWIRQRRCDKALPLLRELLSQRGRILRDYSADSWVVAHLESARCQRDLGHAEEARRDYDEFLTLWQEGIADSSFVQEAIRERKALRGR